MNRWEDKAQITQLMNGWLHRDLNRWDELALLFHPEASIEISWYKGSATDFVEASRQMGRSDLTSRHLTGGPVIMLNDERAFVETPVMLTIQHSALSFGVTSHARFLDRVERRAGNWAIVERRSSYDISSFDSYGGPLPINKDQLAEHPKECKRCSDATLPAPGSVAEVRGWTSPALRPHWTPTLECL